MDQDGTAAYNRQLLQVDDACHFWTSPADQYAALYQEDQEKWLLLQPLPLLLLHVLLPLLPLLLLLRCGCIYLGRTGCTLLLHLMLCLPAH